MKIQAINNTNFRGLFTNKSMQNGGNWLMEYSPYSWESNNTGKMANKTRLDVYASSLPDNEEIYSEGSYHVESSRDILGTESYYKTHDGKMRRTITEVPEMNYEDSLKVQNKKLDVFLQRKQNAKFKLEESVSPLERSIYNESKFYNNWSSEYDKSFFDRAVSKSSIKKELDENKSKIMAFVDEMINNTKSYVKLIGSIEEVRKTKKFNEDTLERIAELKESGKLIDVSRRSISSPNEALLQACKDLKTLPEKVLCLPDRLVTMKSILEQLGHKHSVDDVIRIVEKMIAR